MIVGSASYLPFARALPSFFSSPTRLLSTSKFPLQCIYPISVVLYSSLSLQVNWFCRSQTHISLASVLNQLHSPT
ncbi:hypothetical protein BDV3_003754 [Batrachochytrium dendrobatidis]